MTGSLDDAAAVLVQHRLATQVAALRRHERAARAHDPEGVHQMRVAIRRLRSALATFRPLLDRDVTEPLRAELAWLAGELGEARDLDVQRQRLLDRLAELDEAEAEQVRGPVRERVERELAPRVERARAKAVAALDTDRHAALLQRLDDLASAPPFTERAREPVCGVLRGRVRHDWKRLRGRVAAADECMDPAARPTALHEVRKAAKRARYAAEPLVPTYGSPARRFVKAMKRVQIVLGDQHDAVLSADLVQGLADRAAAAGEDTFTYGVLHARALADAEALDRRFTEVWAEASRPKLRRWLR
jgi:CHAD domain-containing protein